MSNQRDWAQPGVPIDIEGYDANVCPACKVETVVVLNEGVDPPYLVTNECTTCGAWWTARYTLDSVYLRVPKTPLAPCARRESEKEEGT